MLSSGRISELENHRKGSLNPLTVGKSNSSKLRLVLDLRNFNKHMYKEITKVDDQRIMEEYLEKEGFLFKS